MGYKTIADYPNSDGMMPFLYSIRDSIPFAFESILLTIFLILLGGQYFITKSKTGKGKILQNLVTSSFVMIPLSSLLALARLITFKSVLFWAFCTIGFFSLYWISDRS